MSYSRREFGKLALAGLPAAAVLGRAESLFGAFAQAKPNSLINGVQIGAITYSFREMLDQSAEATLKYILDSGMSAVEIMGGPVESFAGIPRAEGGGRGGGRAGGPGGGGRGPGGRGREGAADEIPKRGSWNGVACVLPEDAAAAVRAAGGGGRGRGTPGELTPEQQAARAAQEELTKQIKEWRTSVSMDPFKKLRKMYNDAGVSIYAWKQLGTNMSDEEFEYVFNVAEALGATHTTLELPAGPEAAAQLKRIGDFAVKKKIYAAYHTHLQGSMTCFDEAFAISKGNMANVDLGHWTAGGNKGGSQMDFLNKYHARTSSFHLKDRTTPEHCGLNLPWGTGETPIKDILQLVRKNKWKIPASVEFEYAIPEGSDAVQEVRKCVEYCKAALNAPMTTASR
jgi:sugar phosphate isomerase/epimerase